MSARKIKSSGESSYEITLGALGVALAAGIPTILWGGPGEGKTSVVTATAAELGLHLEVVLASVREPTDFAGLPVVNGGRVSLAPPDWAQRLAESERPAVFFDEVSCAAPATQAALLRVCCDRVVGDLALPPETGHPRRRQPGERRGRRVGARAADGKPVLPPGLAAARGGGGDGVPRGLAGAARTGTARRPCAIPRAGPGADLGLPVWVRPDDVSVLPRDPVQAGRAFPTPRTWEYAARLMAVCGAGGVSEGVQQVVVSGVVGEAAALQLLTYLSELDLPDPETVLAAPDSLKLPCRGDRAYAVLAAVVAAVLSDLSPERWSAGVRAVSQAAVQGQADVGAAAMAALMRKRPTVRGVVVPLPKEIKDFVPVLERAGLLAAG